MKAEAGATIIRNTVFTFLRMVIAIPVSLLLISYILRHLTKAEFGIWALVGLISSYAQLSDFGMTESLIKFMAEFSAQKDSLKLNRLINTALITYIVLGILFCAVFFIVLPFITDRLLHIPADLRLSAMQAFSVALPVFFLSMTMSVFSSLIAGFQKMSYSNIISAVSVVSGALGIIYAINHGYGVLGMVCASASVSIFVAVMNFTVAKILFPEMSINPFMYCRISTLRGIFDFSWKVHVSSLSQLFVMQLDRVMLSHYLGLQSVANYEVANRISYQAKSFIGTLFTPIAPAASAISTAREEDLIVGLYRRTFKYMAIISVSVSFLIIGLARPFVRIWLGGGYETSTLTIQFLSLIYMLNLLTGPGGWILSGINKPHIAMRAAVIAAFLNIALSIVLIRQVGYFGMVAAIFLSISVSGIYFIRLVHHNINGLKWRLYADTLIRPLSLGVTMAALFITADYLVGISGYIPLFVCGTLYVLVLFYGLYCGSYLDKTDKELLIKLNPLRVISGSRQAA